MNKYIVFLIAAICISVLYYGHLHWIGNSKAAALEGRKTKEEYLKKEQESKEIMINRLKPEDNKTQSIIDFLHYRALTKEKVIVSVLGGSATAGVGASSTFNSWPELLKKKLQSDFEGLDNLQLINNGNRGYSTTDLLNGLKIEAVINDQPDLVIFENAMINNYLQSISFKQTEKDLNEIMSKLQKGLPNAKIMIISPNPIANNNANRLGATYLDYISESEKIIKNNQWSYFNSLEGMGKKVRTEKILLVDILANDYIHPNDKGNFIWFEVLLDFLKANR
ncbi:SGNH/GDSL hydrolase family protein [Bacillus sp. CGMCC 1.16607]|uniref:SGNH/GDSL hydrolase family protein n=1 Tax=Bacillus sp. CGMCC 1.16607 TaxID=3351842 RepID=UPI003624B496